MSLLVLYGFQGYGRSTSPFPGLKVRSSYIKNKGECGILVVRTYLPRSSNVPLLLHHDEYGNLKVTSLERYLGCRCN